MLKITDKDKDYVYMYSENDEEVYDIMKKVEMVCSTTYDNCSAIIVRKHEEK